MEKSEVSDTDAPAIRQAIHGSSLRAFLFAARRGEARRARPGVRCTPEVTFVYRRTIAAARMPRVCRSTWFSRIRHTSSAWRIRRANRAEIFRALYTHRRVSPYAPCDAPCKSPLTERRERIKSTP